MFDKIESSKRDSKVIHSAKLQAEKPIHIDSEGDNSSRLKTAMYTTPGRQSEGGVSTSLFLSPDSNYKFSDVAKMNSQFAKGAGYPLQKYHPRTDMPPPHSIPMSAAAMQE